jgi:phage shock protein E
MKTIMRLALSLGILSLVALVGCAPGGTRSGDPSSAKAVIATSEKTAASPAQPVGLCVIDVRTDEEWTTDHVAGALHLPLDQVRTGIGTLVPDKETAIGVYCAHGMRAGRAAKILKELGYSHVENLGGLDDAKKKASNARGTP